MVPRPALSAVPRETALGSVRDALRRIFDFNRAERDRWVAAQARLIPDGARVLDIGAGTCRYKPLFAHCRYESHDFAQLTLDVLFSGADYGEIDYVSDVTNIPVADATFDVALCTEVLEHVPDAAAAVREMARIVRPGGSLLLTAPLGSGIHQAPYHFYGGFTPFWYRKYLGEAGFEEIDVQPNGGFFRFFGQEAGRFNTMLRPSRFRGAGKVVAAMAWVVTWPLCRVAIPLVCHLLDRTDHERSFTIGYHVTARRSGLRPL